MRRTAALAAAALALAGAAAAAQATPAQAPAAPLRVLDKVSGVATELTLSRGESARVGRLTVTLGECRYPAEDPASNAFAWITVHDDLAGEPLFRGWMIAAAPALSALDHPRYDAWVIRCTSTEG